MAEAATTPVAPGPAVPSRTRLVVLAGFAQFGVVWGMYAASIPAIKAATGASDSELGLALSCSGLTALPAMFGAGRVADRIGRHALPIVTAMFVVACVVPLYTRTVPSLVVSLLVLGACSGAFDVVINHAAVQYEAASGRRILNLAHAVFSLSLLVASVATGVLRGAGVPPGALLATAGLAMLVIAGPSWRFLAGLAPPAGKPRPAGARPRARARLGLVIWALGGLGVLALLIENGVQQWSAVFLTDVLSASPAVSGLGPAVFAGSAALGRALGQRLIALLGDVPLLIYAGLVAAPGLVLLATAGSAPIALVGMALAGAGVSVGSPTLYSLAGRAAPAADRGRAIAAVSSVAYVGLLGGPGLVGQVAGMTNLRLALGLLAVIALALTVLVFILGRVTTISHQPAVTEERAIA